MVFSLITGVIGAAVDIVDDVAGEIDDMLFGYDLSDRKRKEITDFVVKCKGAGMSDNEIRNAVILRYDL